MSSSCALQINWNHNQVEFFSLFNWRFFLCSGTSDGSFWFLAVSNMAGSSPLYIILACIDHSVVFPLKIYLMNPVKVKLSDHYSWLNKTYFFLKKDWTSFFSYAGLVVRNAFLLELFEVFCTQISGDLKVWYWSLEFKRYSLWITRKFYEPWNILNADFI